MAQNKQDKNEALPIDPKAFTCTRCNLHQVKTKYVLPTGNINGRILLIGDAPVKDEDLLGRPFVGTSGQLLGELMAGVGLKPEDCYVHTCCMCRPPQSRQPLKEELEACHPYINWIISQMPNLKLIIPLGATAIYSTLKLKKVMDKRGCLTVKDGRTFLPVLHPAAVLRNINHKSLLERDLRFAKEFIEGEIKQGEYILVRDESDLRTLYADLNAAEVIAVDIETSTQEKNSFSNFIDDDIIGMSFAWKEKHGVYLPFKSAGKDFWSKDTMEFAKTTLATILQQPGKKLIFHNGKFDLNFLRKRFDMHLYEYYEVDGKLKFPYHFDTMLAHHLLDENAPHDLKWLSREFSDLAFYENELKNYVKAEKIKDYGNIPLDIIYSYGAADADATLRLYNKFMPQIKERGLDKLFFGLIMPLATVLAQAEYNGVKVDKELLNSLDIKLKADIAASEAEIYRLAGKTFNINSRQQLTEVLFTNLKLPKPKKRTDSGAISTDAETLSGIKHPIIDNLMAYYGAKKLHSTYVVSILEKMDTVDRLHTSYLAHGTTSGRLSSRGPNLQNIPADETYRKIFVAEDGHSFIGSDYSQIELRVLASISKDPTMTNIFIKGGDVHAETARKILNIPDDQEVSKENRKLAKTINFGLVYGMSSKTLAANAGVDEITAVRFLSEYFKKFGGIAKWQNDIKTEARRNKEVKTMLGRVRHLITIDSPDEYIRAEAERQGMNMPIQGSAAECTNLAALQIYLSLQKAGIDSKLVLTVHDELVYEVRNDQVAAAANIIYSTMKNVAESLLGLPVEIDQFIFNRWIEPKEDEQKSYLASIGLAETLLSDIKRSYLGGASTQTP